MTESTGYRARLAERYAHREAYIRDNWQTVSDAEMSDFLGVTEGSVAKYRQELLASVGELQASVKQKIPAELDKADEFKARVEELARRVSE